MQLVRRSRGTQAATAVPEVPGNVEQAVRAAYAASVAAGAPMSQRVMAERFGLSRRRISQLIAEVAGLGNGDLRGSADEQETVDELPWWCQLLWRGTARHGGQRSMTSRLSGVNGVFKRHCPDAYGRCYLNRDPPGL
jgi:hypothetical protein